MILLKQDICKLRYTRIFFLILKLCLKVILLYLEFLESETFQSGF